MQPNSFVTTTTNQYLAPSWQDNVLRDNFFFGLALKKSRPFAGSQVLQPMKYKKGVASVAFSGFDELPITQIPTTINGVYYPSFVATNIALAGSDLSVNKTQEKVIDLMTVEMEARSQDAADDLGNYLYGDGTSDNGKAPMGLSGIIDDGTTLAQYAGLSRATYGMLNAYLTTASNNIITLLQLRLAWNQISDGPIKPDYVLADYSSWGYIENLLNSVQRNNYTNFEKMNSGAGYDHLTWNDMDIYRDKKMPSGTLYMINTRFLRWDNLKWWEGESVSPKAVDVEGNVYEDSMYAPKGVYSWTGWIKALNGAAINGFMIVGGQLVCTAPFRLASISAIQGS